MLKNLINIMAWKPFKSLMFDFAIDVYTTVGKVYDMLLDIANNGTNIYSFDKLYSLTDAIYVILGIFMLFRLTISFLNMLIDPDKASDKQAGAGAIIKRVGISLVLILLFQPNSYLLKPETGL